MPDKSATPSSAPSSTFLQRVFGSEPFSPQIQQGIDIAKKENPNLAPVEPYGFFSRLLQPKALGYVNPGGGTIYLNGPANAGQSPQDIADTLTHEQTHIMQNQRPGYSPSMELIKSMLGMGDSNLPYGQRPNEMEAFQNEKNRRYAMGRGQTAVPSFTNPGEFVIPGGDVNLPNESGRVAPSPSVLQRRIGPVTTPTGPYTGR